MKKTGLKKTVLISLAALLLLAPGTGAGASADRKLEGEYAWNQGPTGPLTAVFTPDGEGWKVAFHFRFRGRDRTYRGTAEGDLSDGELSGEVKNENRRRTFTFEGKFENGTFRGTHAELTSGRPQATGTLTLSEQPAPGAPL